MTERFKLCIDIAAALCILYVPYCAIWAHDNPVPTKPLPLPIIILIADILPCVFGLFWLLYRYMDTLTARFPFINTYMKSPLYQTIGLLVVALVTVLVMKYWR
jgi:hypothetical protein